jgi:hypothetical protein
LLQAHSANTDTTQSKRAKIRFIPSTKSKHPKN